MSVCVWVQLSVSQQGPTIWIDVNNNQINSKQGQNVVSYAMTDDLTERRLVRIVDTGKVYLRYVCGSDELVHRNEQTSIHNPSNYIDTVFHQYVSVDELSNENSLSISWHIQDMCMCER